MIRKEILEACYHLYSPQNNPDQIDKRLGRWYCPVFNRYINIRGCSKKQCPYYYSVDQMMADRV